MTRFGEESLMLGCRSHTQTVVFARNKTRGFQVRFYLSSKTVVRSLLGVLLSRGAPTNVLLRLLAIFLAFPGTRLILSARKKKEDRKNMARNSAGIGVPSSLSSPS
ncbi:MAG: hypothetical protein WB661_13205 [Candidatus Bathyarchaeia archaeon]